MKISNRRLRPNLRLSGPAPSTPHPQNLPKSGLNHIQPIRAIARTDRWCLLPLRFSREPNLPY